MENYTPGQYDYLLSEKVENSRVVVSKNQTDYIKFPIRNQEEFAKYCSQMCVAQDIKPVEVITQPSAFGAVAVFQDAEAMYYFMAWNYETKKSSEDAVLSACKKSHGDKCELFYDFADSCAAIAFNEGTDMFIANRANEQSANEEVLSDCKKDGKSGCKVAETICTNNSATPTISDETQKR